MAYEILNPPFALNFREMSKSQLKAYFAWYQEKIPGRIDVLQQLVRESGRYPQWTADKSPASIAQLGEWFAGEIESVPNTPNGRSRFSANRPSFQIATDGELAPKTLSIAVDIGIYLSQVLMSEIRSLRWAQNLTAKFDIDYGQPVLVEFRAAPFNPSRMLITLAYGILQGSRTKGDLEKLYHFWAKQAVV